MDVSEEWEYVCPICREPIQPGQEVIRIKDSAVHAQCFREQNEAWPAA